MESDNPTQRIKSLLDQTREELDKLNRKIIDLELAAKLREQINRRLKSSIATRQFANSQKE